MLENQMVLGGSRKDMHFFSKTHQLIVRECKALICKYVAFPRNAEMSVKQCVN